MKVNVGNDSYDIAIEYWPDKDSLIKVCKKVEYNAGIAALLSKGHEINDEKSGKTTSYKKSAIVAKVIYETFFLIASSSSTLLQLNSMGGRHLLQGVIIARGVVEACINAAYIMSVGELAAEQAVAHAHAKSYLSLDKTSGKGPHAINVKIDRPYKPSERLLKMVEEFTSTKGRPLNWTSLSVSQRVDEIQKVFGKKIAVGLNSAYLMLYQDASEISHGSFLGALIANGRQPFKKPSFNIEDISKANTLQYTYALAGMFLAIHASLSAYCSYTEISEDFFDLKDSYDTFAETVMGGSVEDFTEKNVKKETR